MKNLELLNFKEDKFILFIYLYIFLMPWNFFNGQMGAFTLIAFIWWIIRKKNNFIENLKYFFSNKPLIVMMIFILFNYLGTLWSENISFALEEIDPLKYIIFMMPVLATSLSYENSKIAIKILLGSFLIYAIFSILIFFGIISINGSSSYNPRGILPYAYVGLYMSILFFWSIIYAFYENNKKIKMCLIVLSIFALITLVINLSRTAQISFILTILVFFIVYFKIFISNKKVIFFIPVILIIFASLLYFNKDRIERYQAAFKEAIVAIENDKYGGSFGARLYFNTVGLDIIKENPFLGVGPFDNSKILGDSVSNNPVEGFKTDGGLASFHNTHFNILTSIGIIGYLIFVISQIFLLYNVKDNKKHFAIILSFILLINFNGLANEMLFSKPLNYTIMAIFIILSILGVKRVKKTD